MSSTNKTDWNYWLDNILNREIYLHISQILPEFELVDKGNYWQSTNTRKLSGADGDSKGKVYVYRDRPGMIKDYREGARNIIKYLEETKSWDFITTVKYLAGIAGVPLPEREGFDEEAYKKRQGRRDLLETLNGYFISLLNEKDKGGKDRDKALKYLQEDRGYDKDTIKDMELGYCPSRQTLLKYLKENGYSEDTLEEIGINGLGIGEVYRITIPFRSGGYIKGFKFRIIGEGIKPKYVNNKGLDKSGGFFNIPSRIAGTKRIAIVEGELDALHATKKGLPNVVAPGGDNVAREQVKDAVRRGAEYFYICFDTEKGKEADTINKVNSVIQTILKEGVSNVYIATLPLTGDKTDPDSYIKENGIDSFEKIISGGKKYTTYYADNLLNGINPDSISDSEADRLKKQITDTYFNIPETDRAQFLRNFEDLKGRGIHKDDIEIKVKELSEIRTIEAQRKEISKTLTEAQGKLSSGDLKGAVQHLEEGIKGIRIERGKDLKENYSPGDWLEEIANTPPSLKTGISAIDEYIRIPQGAVTIIGGRPRHGKTTLMFNMMLEMSRLYPDRKFYFYSYEERRSALLVKILNRTINRDLKNLFTMEEEREYIYNENLLKYYIQNKNRERIPEIDKGIKEVNNLISGGKIEIVDKRYQVEELSSKIAYDCGQENIGAIFIDYVQRIRTGIKSQDRRVEVGNISRHILDEIALAQGLPVILGSQVNRDTTTKGTGKPTLEGLKETGDLEQDANTVLSVYDESIEKVEEGGGADRFTYEYEITALKTRDGGVNIKVNLCWDKWTRYISSNK